MAGLTRATIAPFLGLSSPLAEGLAATALVSILGLIVATGIEISAMTWTTLTALKLLPLFALLGAFVAFGAHGVAASAGPAEVSWLRAGLIVMFAYQGFEIVPVIAGQVRSSAKAIPIATVGSLILSMVLYVGLVWACVSALPNLAGAGAPLAEAAGVYGGPDLSRLVGVGTSVSALGIALGVLVTCTRFLSALAIGQR